jgi:hypothetical protein
MLAFNVTLGCNIRERAGPPDNRVAARLWRSDQRSTPLAYGHALVYRHLSLNFKFQPIVRNRRKNFAKNKR